MSLEPFLRRRPSGHALEWVARSVGDGATIASIKRLRGGDASAVHALTVVDRAGRRYRVVLRRYVRAAWLAREPDLPAREARVLRLLQPSDVPAPELIAVDEAATSCDVPAVLMTRLRGQVTFDSDDVPSWLTQLASALPVIHRVETAGHPPVQRYAPYNDPTQLEPPDWSSKPGLWRTAIDLARRPMAQRDARLIHRDYHPGNVLLYRGHVSGVTDWTNASIGPPEVDVAHCRRNLAVLHGMDVADAFLERYQSVAGSTHYEPYWDVASALDGLPDARAFAGWHDAGLTRISDQLARARLEEFLTAAVARL